MTPEGGEDRWIHRFDKSIDSLTSSILSFYRNVLCIKFFDKEDSVI